MSNTFRFLGFEPTEELLKLAQRIYRELTDLCPTDGDLRGEILSNGNQFVCRMAVNSIALTFNVESMASESLRALQDAHRIARHNISQWHKKRFSA